MNDTVSLHLPFERLTPGGVDRESVVAAMREPSARVISVAQTSELNGTTSFALLPLTAQADADALLFLGHDQRGPLFACSASASMVTDGAAGQSLGGLRMIDWPCEGNRYDLLAFAQGLVAWHRSYRFCPHCGSANTPTAGGHSRICQSDACGRQLFPRTDPCVIALVERGPNILLGRRPEWDAARFSTLAGFIECGESAEQALVREMQEEAGVHVHAWRYLGSQSWPFPRSFMLGYIATTDDEALQRDETELEELRWWHRDELVDVVANGQLMLPPRASIARYLIEQWYLEQVGTPLTTGDQGSRQ
ncbi:NAD(+) diphosphatase [Gammaproteobacteria bacterium]|nr:NAD(+) diphosphatase [Gammaproteobacteria bacterium]